MSILDSKSQKVKELGKRQKLKNNAFRLFSRQRVFLTSTNKICESNRIMYYVNLEITYNRLGRNSCTK